MTLKDKDWLKKETFRLYLWGNSQEDIANQLSISLGTVNNFVQELVKSDDTIELQHQIAIVAKKNGVDITQIAANLRFKNKIKQSSLDDRKIEKFLDGMDKMCNKYGLPPSDAADKLFSIIQAMLRQNIEPHRLKEEIESMVSEVQRLKEQIQDNNNLLEETKARVEIKQKEFRIKEKELDQFHQISNILEVYDYPEFSEEYGNVARAMIDIKNLGYDAKDIVSKYEELQGLTKSIQKLKAELQRIEELLQNYRVKQLEEETKWKEHSSTLNIFTRLIKDGLKEEDIFTAIHILKNDFSPGNIQQLMHDIHTYGTLAASTKRLQIQDELNSSIA